MSESTPHTLLELLERVSAEVAARRSPAKDYRAWIKSLPLETSAPRELYALRVAATYLAQVLLGRRFLELVPRSPLRVKPLHFVAQNVLRRYSELLESPAFRPSAAITRDVGAACSQPGFTMDELAAAYLTLCPDQDRKERGKFYTPYPITKYILERLGFPAADVATRLVDPSCGAGIFLATAARLLRERLRRDDTPPRDTIRAIESALQGYDADPVAVSLAYHRLVHDALDLLVAQRTPLRYVPRIACLDALEAFQPRSQMGLFDAAAAIDTEGTFDFVVGNPPYGKIKEMRPELRAAFAESLYGHPNIYGVFIHLGVLLLKPGGKIGYIVPKSFSSGLYFKNLRRLLAERTYVRELLTIADRHGTFEGVLQENLVLLAQVRNGCREQPVRVREVQDLEDLERNNHALHVPLSEIFLPDVFDHVLFTSSDPTAYAIKRKVFDRGRPLGQMGVRVSTGQLVWNRRKPYLLTSPASAAAPMYWGHNVRMFEFLPERNYASRPPWVRIAGRTVTEICGPRERIIVKRMTAKEEARRIVAARIPADFRSGTEGYYLENHLNFVEYSDTAGLGELLLALFNSRLVDYLFRMINGNTQVSATELRMLPVVVPEDLTYIVSLVRHLETAQDPAAYEALQQEIYRLYELTEIEVDTVEASCPAGVAKREPIIETAALARLTVR